MVFCDVDSTYYILWGIKKSSIFRTFDSLVVICILRNELFVLYDNSDVS